MLRLRRPKEEEPPKQEDGKSKVLYILQIKRAKLNEESMKVLKCLLLHIIRITELQHIILEVYFDEDEFSPLSKYIDAIVKMLVTGYNLLEPEHSRDHPLVALDILLPQLFATRSALLTDGSITHVYFNEETNPL